MQTIKVKKQIYLLGILIGLSLISLTIAEEQLIIPCGGDNQLTINCIGDNQNSLDGNEAVISNIITQPPSGAGGFPISNKYINYNWMYLIIPMIVILIFFYVKKRKKKKEKEEEKKEEE